MLKDSVRASARVWFPAHLAMARGAVIGPGVNVYCMGTISLGEEVLVSQGAHLCAGTHDYDSPQFQLVARPIHIGARAWIAAEAFVGPGTRIGEGAVLGARAVAFGELAAWTVYSGNPARPIRPVARWQLRIALTLSVPEDDWLTPWL